MNISLFSLVLLIGRKWSWVPIVDVVIGLQAGRSGVGILVGETDFSLLQYIQFGSGAHQAYYSMGIRVLPGGKQPRYAINHHLHLVPRLRMSGAVLPFFLYVLHGMDREKFAFTRKNTFEELAELGMSASSQLQNCLSKYFIIGAIVIIHKVHLLKICILHLIIIFCM
jgi:hypothetical protein